MKNLGCTGLTRGAHSACPQRAAPVVIRAPADPQLQAITEEIRRLRAESVFASVISSPEPRALVAGWGFVQR